MKAMILIAALLAGCATGPRVYDPAAEARSNANIMLGLELMRMGRPQAQPMRQPFYCRTVRYGNTLQTVCD